MATPLDTALIGKPTAVYVVTKRDGAGRYVGISCKPQQRWVSHKHNARAGLSGRLYNSLRKYGEDAFEFRVWGWCETVSAARLAEIALIALLKPRYNTARGGEGAWGVKHSKETRAKLSLLRRGIPKSPEHIERIAAANRGRKRTPETCENLRRAHLGNKHSEETRHKMSVAHTGQKRSPQACANMSAAQRRRGPRKPLTAQHRANLAAAQKLRRERERRNGYAS